jgi:hypothetical protein
VAVPSSESLVSIGDLEAELLVVALWDLRAQHHLDISWDEPVYRGALRGKRREFSLRLTPSNGTSATAGLEARLLSALGDSTCDLYALINDRWLDGEKNMAVNGLVVLAQREALSRGLLYRLPVEGRLPRSLAWSKSPFRYEGDSAALEPFEDPAGQLAEDVFDLDNSANREWKTLMEEAKRVLYNSRPYFHFEGGGGG